MTTAKINLLDDFSIVLGGPLFQLLRRARLEGDHLELLYRRVIFFLGITWLPHKIEADMLVDQTQQMGFGNLVFQTEVVEPPFCAGLVPIMINRPPRIGIQHSLSRF
jgi:hypothetical protein